MCGLVGAFPVDEAFVEHALASMVDRGPDSAAFLDLEGCRIGVTRLAITDVLGGSQPLLRDNGTLLVGLNGAIYNWKEIAIDFELDLETGNDAEVIAPLYRKFGLSFADHIDGMYAIIIYDKSANRLITANDHFGIKPLYISKSARGLRVASTLNSFDKESLPTVFRHLPGTVNTSSGDIHTIKVPNAPHADSSALLETLKQSVEQQIPDEVEWGCFLSGGVDSSLICMLARSISRTAPRTFCCGLEGSSDRAAAARLASEFGFDHTDILVEEDQLIPAVEKVILATGSFDPGIVLNGLGVYFVAREARQCGIKVLLSGEGADELFGGYDEHEASPASFLLDHLRFDQTHLGASECLRLDRCSMAWSIEARVPYLTRSMLAIARNLKSNDLIGVKNDNTVRKLILRKAADTILPKWCAWREKEPFFQGASLAQAVHRIAEAQAPNAPIPYLPKELKKYDNLDRMAAWFKVLWDKYYAGWEEEWSELERRGLVRRRYNPYDFSPIPLSANSATERAQNPYPRTRSFIETR